MSKLIQSLTSLRDLARQTGDDDLSLDLDKQIVTLTALLPKALQMATAHIRNNPEPYARLSALLEDGSDAMECIWVDVEPASHIDTDKFEDDDGAVGTYLYHVPGYLSASQQAAVALDLFHGSIGISELEDYEITVVKYPSQSEHYENGSLEGLGEDMQ